MPDFDVKIVSGATVREWGDERANPLPSRPHLRFVGKVGTQIVAHAVYDGEEAPSDVTMTPGLFYSDMGEWPLPHGPPTVGVDTGYSSILWFTPPVAGHYLWVIRRIGGGAIGVHLDVEAA